MSVVDRAALGVIGGGGGGGGVREGLILRPLYRSNVQMRINGHDMDPVFIGRQTD